jgi:hypothetical protein
MKSTSFESKYSNGIVGALLITGLALSTLLAIYIVYAIFFEPPAKISIDNFDEYVALVNEAEQQCIINYPTSTDCRELARAFADTKP